MSYNLSSFASELVGKEVLGKERTSELLVHQSREEQQRVAWPVVHHDVLGLPGDVAGDRDDDAEELALDLRGVILKKTIVAVGAREVEVLELIQFARLHHDGTNVFRAVRCAVHRRDL